MARLCGCAALLCATVWLCLGMTVRLCIARLCGFGFICRFVLLITN
ncbi:MAG: hypothetical protein RR814_04050 [Oscillospiraceae bacterium]